MAEPGQPTSAEIVRPIIAPSWNVRRLQQHVVCNGQEVVNSLLRLASVAELSVLEGMLKRVVPTTNVAVGCLQQR